MKNPIPNTIHALLSLSKILTKAEAHCADNKIDPDAILTARLYPDMMHFTRNVQVCCDTAKGLAARLSQTENPVFEDSEKTFGELQERIAKTIAFMETIDASKFEGAEEREVIMHFGPEERKFTGDSYYNGFAVPNYFFHMTIVHGILRHNGVKIGKRDFLGAA